MMSWISSQLFQVRVLVHDSSSQALRAHLILARTTIQKPAVQVDSNESDDDDDDGTAEDMNGVPSDEDEESGMISSETIQNNRDDHSFPHFYFGPEIIRGRSTMSPPARASMLFSQPFHPHINCDVRKIQLRECPSHKC
jgi:hypothetical protein